MHPPFYLETMAHANSEGRSLFEACLRAGQPVFMDLYSTVDVQNTNMHILE